MGNFYPRIRRTESNFSIYNVPSIHGNDVVSRISDHFRTTPLPPRPSKITAVPIDFQSRIDLEKGPLERRQLPRHHLWNPFEKKRDKEYRNVTSLSVPLYRAIKLNLVTAFLDLVPFLSNFARISLRRSVKIRSSTRKGYSNIEQKEQIIVRFYCLQVIT